MSAGRQKPLTIPLTNRIFSGQKIADHLWMVPLACALAGWELVTRMGLVSSSHLPTFSSVLAVFVVSIQDPAFLMRIAQSFLTLICGLVLAFSIALPTAFVAGNSNRFDGTLTPLVMLFGALPDLSFLPLLVLWFGAGNAAAITMTTVAAFFPIYFTVREGTRNMPRELFEVTSVFKSDHVSTFTKMVLPALSPYIFSGLRLAYDFDWEIIIAVEIATRLSGIGSFIQGTVSTGSMANGFAGILAVALVAVVVDRIFFRSLESWTRKWA
jgi:sulfonate transport system permease protein